MLKHEFEERVGFQVPEEEFNKINAMYLDAGQNIDKDVFCKDYKKHRDSLLLKIFYIQSCNLREELEDYFEMVEFLIGKSRAYDDTDFRRKAVKLVGERKVVLTTMEMGLPLWEEDMKFIKENLR